ncbi:MULTISPECIES: hypothetical protein [Sorangium]
MRLIEAEVKKKRTLKEIQEAKVLAKYDELGKGSSRPTPSSRSSSRS